VAQTTTVHYLDDLDGDQAVGETITFSLDGVSYPIDLSAEHATTPRGDLATWIDHARRTGGRTTGLRASRRASRAESSAQPPSAPDVPRRPDHDRTVAIREWARDNGHKGSDRGRIPAAILAAFNAAAQPSTATHQRR